MSVFSEAAVSFRSINPYFKNTDLPNTDPSERNEYFHFPITTSLPSVTDLAIAVSKALDLLAGKPLRATLKMSVIAGAIAKLMHLPDRDVASIIYAALLHDVGLVGMVSDIYSYLPHNISEKQLFQNHPLHNARVISNPVQNQPVLLTTGIEPLHLSPEVFNLLHQHPLAAKSFIQQMSMSVDVADLILSHHELIDGSGYPFGLNAEQIPFGAKILAFADVVECVLESASKELAVGLTSRRHALESFLSIKTEGKFDPEVIQVFKTLIHENEDFLKRIATREVESMLLSLLPQRSDPMSGCALLSAARSIGTLSDSIMPMYKAGRSARIAELSFRLAEYLEIHPDQCGQLALAALIMDIGQVATPMSILMKTGPLSAAERSMIQDHTMILQDIFKTVPGFDLILLWAGEHHERINGKGYPGQRRGAELSIGGRILGLVDVFDALTSPRPYRTHAHEPLDALPVIVQGRMTLYDQHLVNLLRKILLNRDVPLKIL